MWKPPKLPYYVAPDQLPAPLPTTQEIRASSTILHQRSTQTVKAMGVHFVVKYGPGTKIREGNNLIFLHQHLSSLPIPRLWAMYEEDEDVFIIMEHFEGDTLQDIWPSLQASDKSAITKQLRSIMDQLRALKPPESSFYGSLERGPIPYFLFNSMEANPTINGPFVNEHDFIQGLVRNLRTIDELNQRNSYKTDFYEQNLPSCFRLGRPTLTHGDVQRKNIMVQRTCLQGDGCETAFRLMIIDWEDSGWYPAYWEFFVTFTSLRWDDDWASRIQDFLVPWPAETAALSMIYHDLFF
jgi:aminoglycoside phosphotransferase (APT) family kinase protein